MKASKMDGNRANDAKARRFADVAREVGADESDDALDRAFERLDVKRTTEPKPAATPPQSSDKQR